MDFEKEDLVKLLELNHKGLINDEILARVLNERYLKENTNTVVREKTEEEKREELALANRKRAQEIRERWLAKAEADKLAREMTKQEEETKRKIEEDNKAQDKNIEEMRDYLLSLKNSRGEAVYSNFDIGSLDYFALLKLYEEIKNPPKKEVVEEVPVVEEIFSEPIIVEDTVDNVTYVRHLKEEGTMVLDLVRNKDGIEKYVVYQDKYDLIDFDRISPVLYVNFEDAEKDFEARVTKEKEDLKIYETHIEEKELKPVGINLDENTDKGFKPATFYDTDEVPTIEEPIDVEFEPVITNDDAIDEGFAIPSLNDMDEEFGDLDAKAAFATDPEIDSGFKIVDASPERKEKLKLSKKEAKVKAIKGLMIIATAALGFIGTGIPGAIALAGVSTITYNIFAKMIKDGTWTPKNKAEEFLKYNLEKFMNWGKEDKERVR